MRTVIGLSCVLALFLTATGCGPTETTDNGDTQQEETQAPAETDDAEGEVTESPADESAMEDSEEEDSEEEEMPADETEEVAEEEVPVEEPEVVVETFDTEARPSLLFKIMLEPVTNALESQTSGLGLPGLGG